MGVNISGSAFWTTSNKTTCSRSFGAKPPCQDFYKGDYDNQPEEADDSKCVERVPERKRPDDSPGHLVEANINKILDVWS